jgi:hypothetical protein
VTQIRNGAHALWRFLIAVYALATVVQVFLAGFGIFRADDEGQNKKFSTAFNAHGALGFFLQVGALLLLILALIAWRDKRTVGLSALLFVMLIVQGILAGLGEDHPLVGGLHPVNGFLIVGFSWMLAMRAWGGRSPMHRRESAPVSSA